MARSLGATIVEAVNAQTTDVTFLVLIEFSHSEFSTVYLVNNTVNVTSGGQVYTAFPFSLRLPPDSEEGDPTIIVAMGNPTRLLSTTLRAILGGREIPTATVKLIEFDNPNTILISWTDFQLRNIVYDSESINFELSILNFLDEPFPSESFTPANVPGVF